MESQKRVIPRHAANQSRVVNTTPNIEPNSSVALVERDDEECCQTTDQPNPSERKGDKPVSTRWEPSQFGSLLRSFLRLMLSWSAS